MSKGGEDGKPSRFHLEFLDKFEPQIKQFKKVCSHLGLYVGLLLYTAVGAWVSQLKIHDCQGKIVNPPIQL